MRKMSTGEDFTLGNNLKMAKALFGESSSAVSFLNKKIEEDSDGENAEIIINEGQFVQLLSQIHLNGIRAQESNNFFLK